MPVQIDAEALVRIRSESGQTQEALAQKAGAVPLRIAGTGKRTIRRHHPDEITALARALDVSVDAISLSIKQAS